MLPNYMRQGNIVIEGPVRIPIPRSSALATFAPYRGGEIAQLNNMSPFTKGQYVPALIGDWSGGAVKKYRPYGGIGGGYGETDLLDFATFEAELDADTAAQIKENPPSKPKEKPWWQSTLETIGVAAVENIAKPGDEAPLLPAYVPSTPVASSTPSWVVPVAAGVGVLALVVIIAYVAKDKDEDKAPARRL